MEKLNTTNFFCISASLVGEECATLLRLNRQTSRLSVMKRVSNQDGVMRELYPLREDFDTSCNVLFAIDREILCVFGGNGKSATPYGVFQISKISKFHEEFLSPYHPVHGEVKFYGYVEIFEDYMIHSSMYRNYAGINSKNFMDHPEMIVYGMIENGVEHTSGCIRVPNQLEFDALMMELRPGDALITL